MRTILQSVAWGWAGLLMALLVVLSPGCGGCNSNNAKQPPKKTARERQLEEEEKKKKEKEKPKPDFEMGRLFTQPNNIRLVQSDFKPGHWTSATVEVTANNFDFRGELVTKPRDLAGTPFALGTSRPAPLPKGQLKHVELIYYIPPGKTRNRVEVQLFAAGTRREVEGAVYQTTPLPDHRFHLVVLSTEPDRYSLLRQLPAVNPPHGFNDEESLSYYQLIAPPITKRVPVPSNPLCWTTIAYVVWDRLDPSLMTPEQQQAMVDWLHWGGQLIISGPDSLDGLRTSFLKDYLPAEPGGAKDWDAAALAKLSEQWSQPNEVLQPKNPSRPWSGRELRVDPQQLADGQVQIIAESTQGDPLIVERRVGRGNVVVTGFRLVEKEFGAWKGIDEFYNACIFRHSARAFEFDESAGVYVVWRQPFGQTFTPERVCLLRYLSRDCPIDAQSTLGNALRENQVPGEAAALSAHPANLNTQQEAAAIPWSGFPDAPFGGRNLSDEISDFGPGVAGWTDFNLPAALARIALRDSAGIAIPEGSFVVKIMAIYLAVLVPLNWLIFRLLKRVEWAWIAAPLITIGFAVAVVRLAQLDIGFVRARTEINLVELNGSHPRAHVTRYTALYTSLTTEYQFTYQDPSALVQPFPSLPEEEGRGVLAGQRRQTVNYHRNINENGEGVDIKLDGFEVSSNSLGMIHSEHMLDLEGGLELSGSPSAGYRVRNRTELHLQGAAIVSGNRVAWIGDLPSSATADLAFETATPQSLWNEERHRTWFPASEQAARRPLDLRRLGRLFQWATEPGELRLVAFTKDEVPGLAITPASAQSVEASIVVAHLRFDPLPSPARDVHSYFSALRRAGRDKDFLAPPEEAEDLGP